MSLNVNGKKIEIDEEGFLINPEDWNDEVADALIKQHEADGHKPVSETARGLVDYFREYYNEYKKHPTMHKLLLTLGKHEGKSYAAKEAYKGYLYELFPHGPIQMLCKLAGLPKPSDTNEV